MNDPMWAMGFMSGTSLDGVDGAVIRTDGARVLEVGPTRTVPYDPATRDLLRAALGTRDGHAAAAQALTRVHIDLAHDLIAAAPVPPAVVGFHGQTVWHRPEARETVQIGDPEALADALDMPVVWALRQADVAAGGQGAPLASVYHRALAADLPKPLAVLNLGGVGNVTWIGDGEDILAFDTGPANAPLDDWVRDKLGRAYDAGGEIAAAGTPDGTRVTAALARPYFAVRPPKSLDRNDFTSADADGLSVEDGAATLVEIVAATVAAARDWLPTPPSRWLVTGGGRHNRTMMARLGAYLDAPVDPVEAVGWRGDSLEAEAFALMAVRSLGGRPITFPGTTGAPAPMTGGVLIRPKGAAA